MLRSKDKHIDFLLHKFRNEPWDLIGHTADVTILNQNVFPLSITNLPKRLTEYLHPRPGPIEIAITGDKSDPRHFLRLLRLDWKAKRTEHGAKRKTVEVSSHEFPHMSL
jgi:hypothetical protein